MGPPAVLRSDHGDEFEEELAKQSHRDSTMHLFANSSGVRGTICSYPGATTRSSGLVREVRKSAVVCLGGQI